MKRNLVLSLVVLSLLVLLTACGGNTNTSSTQEIEDQSSSTASSEMDSASSSAPETATTDYAAILGDWKYEGTIDGKTYDVDLELNQGNAFELTVEEESTSEDIDAETSGTYEYDDSSITLSIINVQDTNGYFTGQVVQNEQVKLNYSLSDDGKVMTLKNAPDAVSFLPENLNLTREAD